MTKKGKSKTSNDTAHSEAAANLNIPTIQVRKPSIASLSSDVSSEKLRMKKLNSSEPANSVVSSSTVSAEDAGHPTTVVISDSPRLFLLYGIIILQLAIFITELVIDQFTHSLLILTDSYHHLFNACNAILLVVCFKISNQSSVKNTFGWVRVEVLGMLTTITFIVALIFSLLIEGALQLMHLHEFSTPTNFNVLLIFGVWSLIVNFFYVLTVNGVVTETKYKKTTRTERSFSTANCEPSTSNSTRNEAMMKSHLEVTSTTEIITTPRTSSSSASSADSNNNSKNNRTELPSEQTTGCFLGSLFHGIISPILILLTSGAIYFLQDHDFINTNMADPFMGIVTAVILCIFFFPQLKNTLLILMQTVPQNVDVAIMKKELLEKFRIMQNIHELHIWRLTSANIVATCHIVLPRMTTEDYTSLFDAIKGFISKQYGIAYVTIQPEFSDWNAAEGDELMVVKENDCFMKCPKKECEAACDGLTCCAFGEVDLNQVMVHGHGHGHSHGHGHAH